jgi:DNA recombination protein Rad52
MKPETIRELEKPLNSRHVVQREKGGQELSYVEGWHVIAEANRIFGFDGWTRELVDLVENTPPTTNQRGNFVVSFRARVRVTAQGTVREGTGFGSGIAKDVHDAYESAVKEAETDAMKRALMTFGNPFGLALYDKTQANVVTAPEAQSAVLEALLTNMPTSSHPDAVEWKAGQDAEIKGLSDAEFDIFKAAWAANLKTFAQEKKAA